MWLSSQNSSQRTIILVCFLIVLTFLSFSSVLKAQFLSPQDDRLITQNAAVLNLDLPHVKDAFGHRIEGQYIPLTVLSFSFEKHFFGLNPFIFHLGNLLLHLAVVGLVFYFLLNLGIDLKVVFLACLIFALHPTKVEAIGWVSQRSYILMTLFYMLALICYQKNHLKAYFIFVFLSFFSNWSAVSLLPVILLLDWYQGREFKFKNVLNQWPLFLMLLVWFLLNSKSVSSFHLIQGILLFCWSLMFYIQKFLIPLFCVPVYVLPEPISFFSIPYMLTFVLSGLFFFVLFIFRKNKVFLLSLGLFFFTLFVSLPIGISHKSDNLVSDHLLYLSSVGLSLVAALGIVYVYEFLKKEEKILRQLFVVAVITLILGLALVTYRQGLMWKDNVSLWKESSKVSNHPLILNNLAQAIESSKDYQKKASEIVDLYKKAITVDPKYLPSYNHLARFYENHGQFDEALVWLNKALSMDSKSKETLFNLGVLYQKTGKSSLAVDAFNQLLKVDPDDEESYVQTIKAYGESIEKNPQEKVYKEQREQVLSDYEQLSKRKNYTYLEYFNLGFLYEQVGGAEEARRFYKKSIELKPSYEKALFSLAKNYQQMGDLKTALLVYQQLLHFHPKNASGYLNMGIIYNALGDADRSKMLYLKAIDLSPNDAKPYFYLGYLSESAGQYKDALGYYEKSLENDPKQAEAYYNMGNVYAVLGQEPEAMTAYLKTVGIDPSHQNAYVNLSILSFKSRDFKGAIQYLEKARTLGYNPPAEYLKSLEPYRKK